MTTTPDAYLDRLSEAFSRLSHEFKPLQHRLAELEQENEQLRQAIASAEEITGACAQDNSRIVRQIARLEIRLEILQILEKHRNSYGAGEPSRIALTTIIEEFQ
jgi:cell division septum initiation protein DivIVA